MDLAELRHRFTYHEPDEEKANRHQHARTILMNAAEQVDQLIEDGREKSLAITHLEEAMFWTNAGIAREGNL